MKQLKPQQFVCILVGFGLIAIGITMLVCKNESGLGIILLGALVFTGVFD